MQRFRKVRLRLTRLSATRAVLLMAILFLLLLAAGDGALLWYQRERNLEEATQDAANLTIVLEQYVRQSYANLDALLQNLIALDSRFPGQSASGPTSTVLLRNSELALEFRIFGPDGKLRTGSLTSRLRPADWSTQETFVYLRDSKDPGLFVGRPVQEGGVWRYPLGRRISAPDGSFRGIGVLLMNIDTFSGFFQSINLGQNGSVSIIRRDGEIIARYPAVMGTLGMSIAGSRLFQKQVAPLKEGMISGTSSVDGVKRIGHFRSVTGLPLVVSVFVGQADALAPWNDLVRLHFAILGAVALAVMLLVGLIWRQQAGLARAAEDVREEQRRVETITSHLPAVMMQRTRDAHGKVRFPYISRGSEEILGISPAMLAAHPNLLLDRLRAADRKALVAALKRSTRELTPINEEMRLSHPDGSERWIRVSARARKLGDGSIAWEGLFLDVTAHKAAVADKQALERQLETIVDKIPGVVFQRVLSREGNVRYSFVSPAVQSLFGVSPEKVLKDPRCLVDRTIPEDQKVMSDSFTRRPGDRGQWNREFQVRGPDELLRWVQGTAVRHETEQGDTIWDGIFLDITMQKAAVAATRALQRRMEAIVAEIPGAVFECVQSVDGLRFSFLSPQTESLFAVPVRDLLHNFDRINTYIVSEDQAVLAERLAQHRRDQGDWIEEFRVQSPGRELRWIRGTARARRLDDATLVWNGVFQDVTQVKLAEEGAQRAQRNQALAHLTAGVAHEFNNLLTVIQGNLELLASGTGETADLVSAAQKAADRGANVTRALQAYARRQALRPVTGLLPDMLREVTVLLQSIVGQSIRLEFVLPGDTWPIYVDWDQLGNALIILTINSKEAMPQGGTLRIEASNISLAEPLADLSPGDYVRILVTDSGQGMADEVRRHAFDPFYSAKSVGGGSAQGLSTVFGFVQQSHGYVALDSKEGQGTTVSIFLPKSLHGPEIQDELTHLS